MAELLRAGWGALAIAFAAGLASFFSPCVAPLVPGYVGYIAGTTPSSETSGSAVAVTPRSAVMRPTLLFVAGFSTTFIALGLLTAGAGQLVAAYQPVLETVAGIVMVVMAAFLLDLVPRPLAEALSFDKRLHLRRESVSGLGMLAPVLLGIVFAAGWTPCYGPVLAAILLYVGASASLGQGALLLVFYSLGFAVPFLGIGLGWSAASGVLDWAKRHGRAISTASGVALLIVAAFYLTGQASLFAAWAQRLTPWAAS